jgi:hypothetical protein
VAAARRELLALQKSDVDVLPTLRGERNFWAALRADLNRAVQLVRESTDAVRAVNLDMHVRVWRTPMTRDITLCARLP